MAIRARKSLLWSLAAIAAATIVLAQLETLRVFAAGCTVSGSPTTVANAGQITYSASFVNVTAFQFQYTFPAGETYVSASGANVVCSIAGGTLSCHQGIMSGSNLDVIVQLASSIVGTHTSGTFSLNAQVNNLFGCSTSTTVTTTVQIPVALTGTNWHAGQPVADYFVSAYGQAPVTYSVSAGLPLGLQVASNGAITGTPTTVGTYNFTVSARDANGVTGSQAFQITIEIGALPSPLPPYVPGAFYNVQLVGTGGVPPYTCRLQSGALPAWATLSSSCLLSGTAPSITSSTARTTSARRSDGSGAVSQPLDTGSSSFVVQIADAANHSASLTLTLTSATSVPTLPGLWLLLTALVLIGGGALTVRRRTSA